MNGLGCDPAFHKPLGDAIGGALSPREHDHPAELRLFQQPGEHRRLVPSRDVVNALVDAVDGNRLRRNGHAHRIAQDFAGKHFDSLRHGGREQDRLPCARQNLHEFADIANKAHVEHPVCLVDDEEACLCEIVAALGHMIEETPGRGNEDIHALGYRPDLLTVGDAAHDDGARHFEVPPVSLDALRNLNPKLARGHEISARAVRGLGYSCRPARSCSKGRANAAVFPVPVWARPSTSRPCSRCGIAISWIGVGAV